MFKNAAVHSQAREDHSVGSRARIPRKEMRPGVRSPTSVQDKEPEHRGLQT